MARRHDVNGRFAQAVELFRSGKLGEAAAIFAAIAAAGGARAAEARDYLARIAAFRGGKVPVPRSLKIKRVKAARKRLKKRIKGKKGGHARVRIDRHGKLGRCGSD